MVKLALGLRFTRPGLHLSLRLVMEAVVFIEHRVIEMGHNPYLRLVILALNQVWGIHITQEGNPSVGVTVSELSVKPEL